MKIRGLSIRNFRCIGDEPVEFNDLRDINILVGPNNVGKSTLIAALIKLLGPNPKGFAFEGGNVTIAEDELANHNESANCEMAISCSIAGFLESGVVQQFQIQSNRGLVALSDNLAASQNNITLRLMANGKPTISIGNLTAEIELLSNMQGIKVLTLHSSWKSAFEELLGFNPGVRNAFKRNEPIQSKQLGMELLEDLANSVLHKLNVHCRKTGFVHFPTKRNITHPTQLNVNGPVDFSDNGIGFIGFLQRIWDEDKKDRLSRLFKARDEAAWFFPELSEVTFRVARKPAFSRIEGDGLSHIVVTARGSVQSPICLHGGSVQDIFLLLCSLHFHLKPNEPNLVLIEEPENHLHPPLQARLMEYFCEFVRRPEYSQTQVFITTHSGAMLKQSNSTAIHRLSRLNRSSSPKVYSLPRYEEATHTDDRKRIARFLVPLFLNTVALSECVVLVEGVCDRIVFDAIARRLRAGLPNSKRGLDCEIISMESGDTALSSLTTFRAINPNVYVIIDRNKLPVVSKEIWKLAGFEDKVKINLETLTDKDLKQYQSALRKIGLYVLSRDDIKEYFDPTIEHDGVILALKAVDPACNEVSLPKGSEPERILEEILAMPGAEYQ